MQKSYPFSFIGTCAVLAILFGIIIHRQTHIIPTAAFSAKPTGTRSQITAEAFGRVPLSFECNQGQVDKQVHFLSHGPGYNLFLTSNQVVLTLHTPVPESRTPNPEPRSPNPEPRSPNPDAVLRLKLLGANPHPQVSGVGELPGRVNYFIGNDPTQWRTHVPTYGRVSYKAVYPGIDMVYYGNQKQLEYDWIVGPGADVRQIQVGVKGAEKATLTAQGDLNLHTSNGDVIQHAPIAYQEVGGSRKVVSSRLVLLASSSGTTETRIGFEVGDYDHTRSLVIDPVLVYSTYFGGSGEDQGYGIAVDSVGNAYVTGSTYSVDYPTELPYQSSNLSGDHQSNVFVTALNASGTAVIYSTYLGGSVADFGYGIAVDSAANVYVTGYTTSTNFPTMNAIQATNNASSGATAFVTKINSTGSALVYSTYLGGSVSDMGWAIAVDSSNNAYVTGATTSHDFPTQNAYQQSNGGLNSFVTKINPAGSALVYSTFLGGHGLDGDSGQGIAVDSFGSAYVTGYTNSTDFPTTTGAFETVMPSGGEGPNAFVTKFSSDGTELTYSTYVGGTQGASGSGQVYPGDEGLAIAVDSAGSAYITGYAYSTNFPTAGSHVFQTTNRGGESAFLTKVNPTGNALIYSTYIGGSGSDVGYGIAVDSADNAYVTGKTESNDFPVVSPIQATNPYIASFILKMNSSGSALLYSTYLGGGGDFGNAIAVDSLNTAYVTGYTPADNFPVQNPVQPTNHSGGSYTSFIARIGSYNWQTVDVAVGSNNLARLLWSDTDQMVGLWSVNNTGQGSNLTNFGPFAGYTVRATAAGADGITRLLWNKTDGTTALWLLNANNSFVNGFSYGPYSGWSAVDVAVGSDNSARLLWTKSDGTAAVWNINNSGAPSNLTSFGPFAGWTAIRIAAGSDGLTRVLWTKNDGTVGVWVLNANNTFNTTYNVEPVTGWRVIDLAIGSDNKSRLLFNRSDGTASVWTVDNSGVQTNISNFGPYPGWTATKVACGADGISRLLWFRGDGTQALWLLNSNNSYKTGFSFGPY